MKNIWDYLFEKFANDVRNGENWKIGIYFNQFWYLIVFSINFWWFYHLNVDFWQNSSWNWSQTVFDKIYTRWINSYLLLQFWTSTEFWLTNCNKLKLYFIRNKLNTLTERMKLTVIQLTRVWMNIYLLKNMQRKESDQQTWITTINAYFHHTMLPLDRLINSYNILLVIHLRKGKRFLFLRFPSTSKLASVSSSQINLNSRKLTNHAKPLSSSDLLVDTRPAPIKTRKSRSHLEN